MINRQVQIYKPFMWV